jgi:hypothetical protein
MHLSHIPADPCHASGIWGIAATTTGKLRLMTGNRWYVCLRRRSRAESSSRQRTVSPLTCSGSNRVIGSTSQPARVPGLPLSLASRESCRRLPAPLLLALRDNRLDASETGVLHSPAGLTGLSHAGLRLVASRQSGRPKQPEEQLRYGSLSCRPAGTARRNSTDNSKGGRRACLETSKLVLLCSSCWWSS